jgi:hypothetical protein
MEEAMVATTIDFVKELYGAFARADLDAIAAACTPDVHWEVQGQPQHFPALGPRRSPDGVRQFFRTTGETLEFTEFEPEEFHASGDKVFVLGHYRASVRRTGKTFASPWVHVFTVRNGRLAGFREFTDTARLADAYRS